MCCKVLRYIPIIPCLQQLFKWINISKFMDYHAKNISKDGVLWILVDGSIFSNIEERWPKFKEEPRNLRISLAATNYVNPFRELWSTYLVWLIFVINNNIPPWISIKREHIMLSMIIPCMCLQPFFNVVASHFSYFVA